MAEYKFYNIDPAGHIAGPPMVVEYPDDITAVKEAEKLLDGHDIEIWRGTHVVSYLVSLNKKQG